MSFLTSADVPTGHTAHRSSTTGLCYEAAGNWSSEADMVVLSERLSQLKIERREKEITERKKNIKENKACKIFKFIYRITNCVAINLRNCVSLQMRS